MKYAFIAAFAAACSLTAMVQPAAACPAGYHKVYIQGHGICRINTPNLPLKANTGPSLGKAGAALKR